MNTTHLFFFNTSLAVIAPNTRPLIVAYINSTSPASFVVKEVPSRFYLVKMLFLALVLQNGTGY